MVGTRIVSALEERGFPMRELRILATSSRTQEIAGREREVLEVSQEALDGLDIALFAGTEGETGASHLYGWGAVAKGVFVVDNGGDFRMDRRVPLVVPEVNAEAMRSHEGFVANPNCSTIQMVMVLEPLRRAAGLRRVVVSTYQSVSGTGRPGIRALEEQRRKGGSDGTDLGPYSHPIYDNVLPHISSLRDRFPGYYGEEIKMIEEARKIMGLSDLPVTATCARVPVAYCHAESLNVELEREVSVEEARALLGAFDGVVVHDDPADAVYPLPAEAVGQDAVVVGRIRKDPSRPNTLDLWCVADNLRKGAATNALQIAEKAVDMGLV
jgi:aspartate-semialdehyde dehydrogenase